MGRGRICWTLVSYILLRFLQKKCKISQKNCRARSPQTTPKSTHSLFTLKTLSFSIICVLSKIQFGNSQERFDNLTYSAMWNGNLFLFVNHILVITTKWILHVLRTLKIFSRNDMHADLSSVISVKDKDSL